MKKISNFSLIDSWLEKYCARISGRKSFITFYFEKNIFFGRELIFLVLHEVINYSLMKPNHSIIYLPMSIIQRNSINLRINTKTIIKSLINYPTQYEINANL